jgi:hypothetical protein
MDAAENPLETAAGAGRVTDEDPAPEMMLRLARDANTSTVPSAFYPEQRQLGALLSTASSAPCYGMQATCVAFGVNVTGLLPWAGKAQSDADMVGMAEPNDLLYVSAILLGLGFASLALVVASARYALRPGGALEQLKAGEAMISEKDGTTLSRWRVGLGVLSALFLLFGLQQIAAGTVFSKDYYTVQDRLVRFSLKGLILATTLPVAFSGWMASMYTGSCLCRDGVMKVIGAIRSTDPTADEWDEAVAQPALALREKMKLLSRGWAGGLVGFGGFFWGMALGLFTSAINLPYHEAMEAANGEVAVTNRHTYKTSYMMYTLVFAMLPLLLAKDLANTSTCCDNLMAELNEVRAKYGTESHFKIQCLETTLKQLVRSSRAAFAALCVHTQANYLVSTCHQNSGQGLGFVLMGTVVDKKTLQTAAFQLIGALTTVVTALFALQTPSSAAHATAAGDELCTLSAVQTSIIQSMLMDRNASCSYNISLASIID